MTELNPLILNVDDNDGARYAKTRSLQLAGFRVLEAINGTEALSTVREQMPDLVLLDVKLPDINGIEVCRLIKSDPATAGIMVLQTSAALTGRADKIRGLEGGADNYLAAPIETDELIANVKALLRLRQAQTALRESEERFRQMANNINDVFWIFSHDNRALLYVSPAYHLLWGCAEGAEDWLHGIHADDRGRVQSRFDALFASQHYDEEYRILRSDGSMRWVRDRGFLVRNEQNEVCRVARISSDITVSKNAERQLREADAHKDEFLATLGHELRNPLGPIRSAATLLQRTPALPAAMQLKATEVIARQVDHLARLVDDLLDVARVSQGKIVLQCARIEIQSFISVAVETMQPFITARQHTLSQTLPGQKLWVMGDAVRLSQAVSNLLHNAAKYTAAGGEIQLSARELENNRVEIQVRDNGIGVDAEHAQQLFKLFAQGDVAPDRAQDGLGIGLNIVKRLIELHGGVISMHSAGKQCGTTFTINLPLCNAQAPGPAMEQEKTALVVSNQKLVVLVVDDNRDAVELSYLLLQSLGYTAHTAHDADSVMLAVNAHRPDVILLDIGLPGTDGYQIARLLRQKPDLQNTVLIAVTGYGSERDIQKALDAGFDHHLVKPAAAEKLLELLEQVSRRSET